MEVVSPILWEELAAVADESVFPDSRFLAASKVET